MGRGRSKAGGSGGRVITPLGVLDVWSYRHRKGNEPFVDAINTAARSMESDFPGLMQDVGTLNAVKLRGRDNGVLGYFSRDGRGGTSVNINQEYTDLAEMDAVMDRAAKSGFHPSRGNKSGVEAVSLHELGHALNNHVAAKMGFNPNDVFKMEYAADKIVKDARKAAGKIAGRGGIEQFRRSISGYSSGSNTETIAEAVADYYCNGSRAHANSRAIMAELFKYR